MVSFYTPLPTENIWKPLAFCFPGVQKETSIMKWVKLFQINLFFILLENVRKTEISLMLSGRRVKSIGLKWVLAFILCLIDYNMPKKMLNAIMLLVKQILGGIKEPSDIKWVDPF